jgi:hypothetical protein
MDFSDLKQIPLAEYCEKGKVPSGSREGWEHSYQLSDCELVKNDSAVWS